MLRVEYSPNNVANVLPQIIEIADQDKEALGFLPPSAFHDACRQGRVIAALDEKCGQTHVVGYILYGGLFPHARIYQIGVSTAHRRHGTASKLVDALVSKLEASAYLTLSAKVANDLPSAIGFYLANGFEKRREVMGGAARGRKLSIYSRSLRTDDLFTLSDVKESTESMLALALRASRTGDPPFCVIDLNVLFDLVRNRSRSKDARLLFGAALAHRIRLVISPEFLVELRRTSKQPADDVILHMALQMPKLAIADPARLETTAAMVHHLVFEVPRLASAGTAQSLSDAKHLAHAAVSNASTYITSDGAILAAKDALRKTVGIDVASLSELVELLADRKSDARTQPVKGGGFEIVQPTPVAVSEYIARNPALIKVIPDRNRPTLDEHTSTLAVNLEGDLAALCILVRPSTPNSAARIVLHPDPSILDSVGFLDTLFDRAIAEATSVGPTLVELWQADDQSMGFVSEFARSRGFLRANQSAPFIKTVLGRPLTQGTWDSTSTSLRRRTGIELGSLGRETSSSVQVYFPGREPLALSWAALENLIGPTIIAWPGRPAVIQPIARSYADDLLGTGHQFSFLESKGAAFLSQRSYVSTPRSAGLMRPGSMLFFYESQRTGGRGAIVAVARIVESLVLSKDAVSHHHERHLVVPEVSRFAAGKDVLLTSFDNLLALPRPCPLGTLRLFGLVGSQNLQSTTPIPEDGASKILDFAWADRAHG